MKSLYDELADKADRETRLTARNVPRMDLSLLLYNGRADLRALWVAADGQVAGGGASDALRDAVDALRPIFGERP